jgi:hypothetical protein
VRVHFKDVIEPNLKEGSDLMANCGAIVKNAQFAMKFDFELGDILDWNALLICQECLEIEPRERFIYGLVSKEGGTS